MHLLSKVRRPPPLVSDRVDLLMCLKERRKSRRNLRLATAELSLLDSRGLALLPRQLLRARKREGSVCIS